MRPFNANLKWVQVLHSFNIKNKLKKLKQENLAKIQLANKISKYKENLKQSRLN